MSDKPKGFLTIRTVVMPRDANSHGDAFGGWLLAQMDLAGAALAYKIAEGQVATIALNAMKFHNPVFIGDLVSCYASLVKVGNTSITIDVEAWVSRQSDEKMHRVTEGVFVFVAVDKDRKPRKVPPLKEEN